MSTTPFRKRIIIGGPPRSGTTLLRFMLDRSETILSGPETSFFLYPFAEQQTKRLERVSARLADRLDLDLAAVQQTIRNATNAFEAFDRLMHLVRMEAQLHKEVWAEKTPRNCLHYGRLAAENPDLYFLSIVRHGLDIVTSKIEGHPRRPDDYWCSIDRYVESMQAVYSFQHPRHKIVRYEDLVQTPEAATRDLFEFLDEPFTPAVISDFQQNSRTRNLEKVHQPKLQSGISTEWVGRWQKPEHAERVDSFRRHPQAMQWLVQSGYSEKGLP